MPKFLIHGSYSAEGLKGLLKEGGTSRKRTIEKLAEGLGGGGSRQPTSPSARMTSS